MQEVCLIKHMTQAMIIQAMIAAYAQIGLPDEALKIFDDMQKFGCACH